MFGWCAEVSTGRGRGCGVAFGALLEQAAKLKIDINPTTITARCARIPGKT